MPLSLAQMDALARVTGRQFSAPREVVRQTVIDRTSAMHASLAHERQPEDDHEFRQIRSMFSDRYGK